MDNLPEAIENIILDYTAELNHHSHYKTTLNLINNIKIEREDPGIIDNIKYTTWYIPAPDKPNNHELLNFICIHGNIAKLYNDEFFICACSADIYGC